MTIIVVSDIFGVTPQLKSLIHRFGKNVIVVDPYQSQEKRFASEQVAYQYFMSYVGLPAYTSAVAKTCQSVDGPVILIGFSIGASAIWALSDTDNETGYGKTMPATEHQLGLCRDATYTDVKPQVTFAVCFYGSQIRNALSVEPTFPIHMVYPKSEPHFSVTNLVNQLSSKVNVTVEQSQYHHGFMNELSNNYNQDAYHFYLDKLQDRIIDCIGTKKP